MNHILATVIPYLTSSSLINLSLTNYEYYQPCMIQLYKNILIIPLKLPSAISNFHKFTILDSTLNINVNPLAVLDHDKQNLVIASKLKVLIQSIMINRELGGYVDNVLIFGNYNVEIMNLLKQLTSLISGRLFIENETIRKYVGIENEPISPSLINPIRVTNLNHLTIELTKPIEADIPNITHMSKLSIIHKNPYTHKDAELIDLSLLKMFTNNLKLNYLCIKYSPPSNGMINDGFEGNYHRRIKILETLIKLVSLWNHKISLVLPNYLQILSCYEQQMNNLMWNGCKCNHCNKYLGKLDDFIHHHKYYDNDLGYWKDLNNSIMISQLSIMYQSRYNNTNNFDYFNPLKFENYNIHTNFFSGIDFQCFDEENVNHGEYNEGEEIYFDTQLTISKCKYSKLLRHLSPCITHYFETIINGLIDLDRGDAESRDIIEDFITDGESNINLVNLSLNGFQFFFDIELNGTNYFKNYYPVRETEIQ